MPSNTNSLTNELTAVSGFNNAGLLAVAVSTAVPIAPSVLVGTTTTVLTRRPGTSASTVSSTGTATAAFTPDVPGLYVVTVSQGGASSVYSVLAVSAATLTMKTDACRAVARLAPAYAPRRPTETVLYGAVRANLETFLAHTRETYAKPLPRYVEQEFRSFLKCGVFAHGFARCRCESCGDDLLVAFSCKLRGICPSCSGRRMANGAAHLVDRVLPDVPVRQFVLSLPFELRRLAAFRPAVLTALSRIFVETVFASYRARAKREGIKGAECGALTFVQRSVEV